LYVIDKLKEGIGLRGYAQKDPLVEYKKEAFKAFESLNNTFKSDAVEKVMRVQLVAQQSHEDIMDSFRPDEANLDELDYSSPSEADIGHSLDQAASVDESPRMNKMTFQGGPSRERPMNREERRRLEKQGKGKK
jgi:preprotein translocase subunit SecA